MSEFTKCPRGCVHEATWHEDVKYCAYIFDEGHPRGCEGGANCEKYKPAPGVKPPRRKPVTVLNSKVNRENNKDWHDTAYRMLFKEFKSMREIAAACGVTPWAVDKWRRRHNYPSTKEIHQMAAEKVGNAIRLYREANGFSIKNFAQRMGVAESTVIHWQDGFSLAPEHVRIIVGAKL